MGALLANSHPAIDEVERLTDTDRRSRSSFMLMLSAAINRSASVSWRGKTC